MAGIRKEKFISWKLFIYRHPDCSTTEANTKIILLLTTLPDFNLGIPGGMTNIEMIFNPCLHVLKHVLGYHSHITYAGYQLLKIIVFDLVDEVRNYFTYMMPGGWFGKRTPIAWCLRSPDLTPPDCRESIPYVNNLVYLVKKQALQQMKAHIRDAMSAVTYNMPQNMWTEFEYFLDIC